MNRFLIAMLVGTTIAAAGSTSASASPPGQKPQRTAGTAFTSYWKEHNQYRCAGAYTAAVGLVATIAWCRPY